ncbi:MOSC domain-containing protein [Sedimentimonas flavescens]|uniref:MOSC domain-containing protein n=1 Tax=Sedimentimonas flavescens TaxID=2851012 RepID=UPI0021A836E0|nr:MOSC domain-containing protein [Sedimentimonas flavescens]MCT2539429.1 MOSC domain-containing protein [Sedimentimonas flavescens]
MTARLAHIFRHPIKSVGYEEIRSAPLTKGRVLPFDRVWAIAHEGAKFDAPLSEWASKTNFVRGVAAPGLMAVQAKTQDDGTIELAHPDLWHLRIAPDRAEDQVKLIEWLRPLWPENRPAPRSVESVAGAALSDMPDPYVSILSLGSLAALSQRAGTPMSPHRFRGNLWVDGWNAGAERDLIGRRLKIGATELEIAMPITRCRATCANPETGSADIDTLALLDAQWGDHEFGLYATVITGGEIARGDSVEVL